MKQVLKWAGNSWQTIVLVLTPIALSPLLIFDWFDQSASRCCFVVLIMAIFWSTEPIPVPVTALMPVFLLPLLSIVSTEEACKPYMQEPNMVFIGSLIFAIAVEKSNLHKRIALLILRVVGTNFDRLVLGFMMTTMLVSMWVRKKEQKVQ